MSKFKPLTTETHMLLSGELHVRKVEHVNEFTVFRPGILYCKRCQKEFEDPDAVNFVGQYTSVKHFEECPHCHSPTVDTKSYSLDIFLPKKSVCIEIDGSSHDSARRQKKDRWRTEFLNSKGIKVVRLRNKHIESYCEEIADLVAALV